MMSLSGVGGHGGAGIHADVEDKYQSIMQRLSVYCTPKAQPQVNVRICKTTSGSFMYVKVKVTLCQWETILGRRGKFATLFFTMFP